MKKASRFEIIAARGWNLVNEGKPFTPIFVLGAYLIFNMALWENSQFWLTTGLSLLTILPIAAIYYIYDFPLLLRNYLWIPFVVYVVLWKEMNIELALFSIGLYFFFTVFFWGTFYYHLRIGTSWLNFTRFWKLVLKNSDSTSGNAQEQMPKFLLLIGLLDFNRNLLASGVSFLQLDWNTITLFSGFVFMFSWILHRYLFDWKPKEVEGYTREKTTENRIPLTKKVIVIIVDGARKDRFAEANTPFFDRLRQNGTEYTQMETVYPARTVVCFSSIFTGTYPIEHGIKSNMVWKLGIKVESIFDSLRKIGKKGRLLGIAHLIDAMGEDVESVTAVMKNDEADRNIMERAKQIMAEQDPDLLAIQFIATDQTGHSRGSLYEEYKQKIEEADRLSEEFIDWLTEQGKMEDTTIIVAADHGQSDGIGGHGHLDEGERYVPFIISGPSIEKGVKVEEKYSLISVAPTIAYLLGAPFPSHSRGPVLLQALKKERKDLVS